MTPGVAGQWSDTGPAAVSKLGGSIIHLTLPVSFGRDTISPFYLVSMLGKMTDPTQGSGKTSVVDY